MGEGLIDASLLVGKYDESNPLVLIPKRKSVLKRAAADRPPKILSRSRKKELQKLVAKKQKKLTRGALWKELEGLTGKNATTTALYKLFSRNRKSERKVERLSKSYLLKSKRWRDSSSPSGSSIVSDSLSSTEELLSESIGQTCPPEVTRSQVIESDPALLLNKSGDFESVKTQTTASIPFDGGMRVMYVPVNRSPDIQTARLTLPIVSEEARIMEKISENDVVIICGATGCGKTTQVPQFLYEAGYTRDNYKIGITEPRRVAAITMCERVSEELGFNNGEVGYHIRYGKNISTKTQIKFMTDGILLQEMKKDFELSSYSVILVDEAHERSVYTDVLLGLLSLVTRLRRRAYNEKPDSALLPLKLIIMSATLRVEDFADNKRLFPTVKANPGGESKCDDDDEREGQRPGAPPVLKVESRQFPVTCHFSRHTPDDYLKAAFRKVMDIHRDAAPGGILVFLTGQREVRTLCNWLLKAFPITESADTKAKTRRGKKEDVVEAEPYKNKAKKRKRAKTEAEENSKGEKSADRINLNEMEEDLSIEESPSISRFNLDNFDIIPADEEVEVGLGSEGRRIWNPLKGDGTDDKSIRRQVIEEDSDDYGDEDAIDAEVLRELRESNNQTQLTPILALPLYSLLPAEQQRRVFKPPPEGCRLVVVATNVAETSLTIPNIRYVVDTGKVKSKIYDTGTGASCFRIVWISRASAEQRAGRAGRIGPGHCYRLYSSRVFADEMAPFTAPEILTRPVDEVVLLLKSYLGSTPLSRFPLPTSPTAAAVEAAERRLTALGALEEKKVGTETLRTITPAGRWMARLPLPARFARMLLFANQHNLMPYAVVLVTALSVPDFFLSDPQPPPTLVEDAATVVEQRRKRAQISAAERLAQVRVKFLRQFVKTETDLMLGDLAVLLGAVCCFERYWAQLVGVVPVDEGSGLPLRIDRVSRLNPEATMRELVQKCGVRWRAYVEVRQLRRQLTDILNANVQGLNLELDPALPKPTTTQVEQLRQLFLVGSVCHLAAKYDLPVEDLPAKDRRRLRYAYKVPGVPEPVFIEADSPLARENYSFVAFTELHTSSKPYLRNVCAINPAWVPFLAPHSYCIDGLNVMENAVSEPTTADKPSVLGTDMGEDEGEKAEKITQPFTKTTAAVGQCPAPFYDTEHDAVLVYAKHVVFVGANFVDSEVTAPAEVGSMENGFELPALHTPFPLTSGPAATSLGDHECLVWSVRWFARFLLEGKVYPRQLASWFPKSVRTSTPTRMITLSWGLVRPEVRGLISKMLPNRVNSKRTLEGCLAKDPDFLSRELTAWLPPNCHAKFLMKWHSLRRK
uniref:RNA helicase n=1 Tax=Echinococcus granulosus TaxID=6210 RepID=A0A068WIS7_ECHGR|nr:ATP dependent RNA helicase DHX37 [Echinococcus granulosus]